MTTDVLADDALLSPWPIPADDDHRVAALRAFGVLDQPPAVDLEAAARLAAYVCGVPHAVINLIDSDRQWQAAAHGTERGEVRREDSLCAHVVTGTEVVHVEDASADPRFAGSPLVTGPLAEVRLYASAPLVTRDGYSIGTVCAYDRTSGRLTDEQLGLLVDIANQVMALFEMRRTSAALAQAASRDVLTGLPNRRTWEQAVGAALARAERGLGTPSVVVIDLDGFKEVNDSRGHAAGDAALRAVAARLSATARVVDVVARLGGDEFAVLLEATVGQGAVAALGRLRDGLDAKDDPALVGVGASLGLASYRPGDSVASLLARADAEMYADKTSRQV